MSKLKLVSIMLAASMCSCSGQSSPRELDIHHTATIGEDSTTVLLDPSSAAMHTDSTAIVIDHNGKVAYVVNLLDGRISGTIRPDVSLLDSVWRHDQHVRNSTFFSIDRYSDMVAEHGEPDPSFSSLMISPLFLNAQPTIGGKAWLTTATRVPAHRVSNNEYTWPSIVGALQIDSMGVSTKYISFSVRDFRFPQLISQSPSGNGWWATTFDFEELKKKAVDSMPYVVYYNANGQQTERAILLPPAMARRQAYFSLNNDFVVLSPECGVTIDEKTGELLVANLKTHTSTSIPASEWLSYTGIDTTGWNNYRHIMRIDSNTIEFIVNNRDSANNVRLACIVRLRLSLGFAGADIEHGSVSKMLSGTNVGPGIKQGTDSRARNSYRLMSTGENWEIVKCAEKL